MFDESDLTLLYSECLSTSSLQSHRRERSGVRTQVHPLRQCNADDLKRRLIVIRELQRKVFSVLRLS